MDEEDVVYIYIYTYTYNRILLNHRINTFHSVLVRWMKLEPVTQSEVRNRKTNIIY